MKLLQAFGQFAAAGAAGAVYGLEPMIASAATFTGGSGSLDSTTGRVTFTAINAVALDNLFDPAYTHFYFAFSVQGSISNNLETRYRVGGVNSITAYARQYVSQSSGTSAGRQSLDHAVLGSTSTSSPAAPTGIIAYPNLARYTISTNDVGTDPNPGYVRNAIVHSVSTAYDGIYIILGGGGNMTGSMQFFGFRNEVA